MPQLAIQKCVFFYWYACSLLEKNTDHDMSWTNCHALWNNLVYFNAQYLLSCLISILCFSSRCLSHHTRTNENFCVWLFFNWNQSHYSIITFHFCFCAEADSSCSLTWCPSIIKATFQDKYLTFCLLLKKFYFIDISTVSHYKTANLWKVVIVITSSL